MRVVMTGGGGFIGSHVLARLIGAGMAVTLIGPDVGRSQYTASVVAAGAARFVRCDSSFRDEDLLQRTVEDADALILLRHVAPELPTPVGNLVEELDGNVGPLARILRAAGGAGRHIVFASSDAVYGVPARTPVREIDATRPQTAFSVAKLASEQAVRLVCSQSGASASILRYGQVYGPGETASRAIPIFIRAALSGRAPEIDGEGLNECDYVHVADAVDATMSALRRKADGVFNVCTGIGTTTLELANLILWLAGSASAPVHCSQGKSSQDRMSLVLDPGLTQSELGVVSRHSLPEGLTEEIGWFRAQLGGTLKTAA